MFSFLRNFFVRTTESAVEVPGERFLITFPPQRNISQVLSEHREMFRNSLVGTWVSRTGTFSLMGERMVIYPNQTGRFDTYSGSGDATTYFDWEQAGDYHVRFRVTGFTDYEPDVSTEDSEDEPEEWCEIHYHFTITATDVADFVVIGQILPDGTSHDTFWGSLFHLGYRGEPEDG